MDKYIESDLFRCSAQKTRLALYKRLWIDPMFRYLFFYRKSKLHSKYTPHGLFYHLFYLKYTFKYGIQIPKSVDIGKGFLLLHFGGIVINSRTKIGENCTIMHNVTLGNTKRGSNAGAPSLGNKVYVGPGAVIVGGVNIGDNVLVAPNAYVNFDVPSNSIVLGNPAKIIESESATLSYINNVV